MRIYLLKLSYHFDSLGRFFDKKNSDSMMLVQTQSLSTLFYINAMRSDFVPAVTCRVVTDSAEKSTSLHNGTIVAHAISTPFLCTP